MKSQRLLVSIRGKNEALEAVKGGAHILDVEYPMSALGTPYPLNINMVRKHVPRDRAVSTNIGEKQFRWSTVSQAALGVALAGADIIKVGLAWLEPDDAVKAMNRAIRNVKKWFREKTLVATLFVDEELTRFVDPVKEGHLVAYEAGAEGTLIDTFDKDKDKGLLDYINIKEIRSFAKLCHKY